MKTPLEMCQSFKLQQYFLLLFLHVSLIKFHYQLLFQGQMKETACIFAKLSNTDDFFIPLG